MDPALLEQVFAANTFSVFYCNREALRRMSTKHGGRGGAIVTISSVAARHGGLPMETPYAASKGALDSLTVGLAKEVGKEGVRVNAIRPGMIVTEIHAAHGGQATIDAVARVVRAWRRDRGLGRSLTACVAAGRRRRSGGPVCRRSQPYALINQALGALRAARCIARATNRLACSLPVA